jgi:hypothetical protein
MPLNIRAHGVQEAIRRAQGLRQQLIDDIDADVEAATLAAVNRSRAAAPVLTGALRNSIDMIPQETRIMRRAFGSDRPYARRQEYEHKTKRGYLRRSLWVARTDLRAAIERSIRRTGL